MENKHEEQRKQFWMDAWIANHGLNKDSDPDYSTLLADKALKAFDRRFPNPSIVYAPYQRTVEDTITKETKCDSCMLFAGKTCMECVDFDKYKPKYNECKSVPFK